MGKLRLLSSPLFLLILSVGHRRFGNLFRTHILGCPTVICMDAEVNRYIIVNEGKGLVPGYPQSMVDMMGKWNIAAVHGPQHKAMRSAMLGLISPTAIRDQLLPKIDEFMRSFIRSWSDQVIDIQEESKEVGRFINSILSITLMLIIME